MVVKNLIKKSSTSLPGGNQVDGLPPAFRVQNLLKAHDS